MREKKENGMRKLNDRCYQFTVLLSCILVSLPAPAWSQALVGQNFPVTNAIELQEAPAVAANAANGEFLVVWHDLRPDGPVQLDIFAQRVGSNGTLIGGNFPVSTLGGSNPDVAFNTAANEFLVVYQRGTGILGQRVTPDGSLVGAEFPIITQSFQNNPAIAYNPLANQYLVVWNRSGGGVRGQVLDGNGTLVAPVLDLSTSLVGAVNPAVAVNATGQYLVVWDAFSGSFPRAGDVFGRLVNADGTAAGNFFPLTTADQSQFSPAVAPNPAAGQYFVVWSDSRNFGVNQDDIFGQVVNADGSLAGGNVPISTSPFEERSPSVAHTSATNQYLAVWTGQPPGTVGEIFGRLFAADGSPLGAAFQISTAGTAQFFTDLAVNPVTNLFFSVWPDDRNAQTSSTDIFGQLITLAMQVAIDIKPGGEVNSINPKSRGKIPVAILSNPGFDAPAEVDQDRLTFGRTGDERSLAFCNKGRHDVNGDGLADLMCHFHTQAADFKSGVTRGILKGETLSGTPFTAGDSVRIVPPRE